MRPVRHLRNLRPLAVFVSLASILLAAPSAARAWTPAFQVALAREAARLAPPDLAEQIARHEEDFRQGVLAPFSDGDARRHVANPDGTGTLPRAVAEETERAVSMIRSLAPFDQVVHQLGVVAHFVADAHNPLNAADSDPEEARYYADYLRYAESAEPRFPLVFYGFRAHFGDPRAVDALVADALARGRQLYPLLGREYRRIGFAGGVASFDDRSTAFGVTSVEFSRAASDIAQVLRYIWLRAGGADPRTALPVRGEDLLVRIPRTTVKRSLVPGRAPGR